MNLNKLFTQLNESFETNMSLFDRYYNIEKFDDNIEKHDYFVGLKDDINENHSDFEYFQIAATEHEDGRIYLDVMSSYDVGIGDSEFDVFDILEDSFFKDYNDGSEEFQSDYDYHLPRIKKELRKINDEVLPLLAGKWGFKKDRKFIRKEITEEISEERQKKARKAHRLRESSHHAIDYHVVAYFDPEDEEHGYEAYDWFDDEYDAREAFEDYKEKDNCVEAWIEYVETLGGIIADSGQLEHYVKEEEI